MKEKSDMPAATRNQTTEPFSMDTPPATVTALQWGTAEGKLTPFGINCIDKKSHPELARDDVTLPGKKEPIVPCIAQAGVRLRRYRACNDHNFSIHLTEETMPLHSEGDVLFCRSPPQVDRRSTGNLEYQNFRSL